MLQNDEQLHLSEHLTGDINPGTAFGQRYDFLINQPVPETTEVDSSPWAGLSGAALFSGDLIIGIIQADLPLWKSKRITALPIYHLLQDEGFSSKLAEHGCPVRLESVELSPLLERGTVRLDSPASLLRADSEVVRFHGREYLLENLLSWCRGDQEFSVRLLTAPGGLGRLGWPGICS